MKLNKRQKSLIYNSIFVVVITAATIIGMFNFKDYVNRKESMRAMHHLSQICLNYRKENNMVPSTHYIENIKKQLEGAARASQIVYRGRWITFGATGDEILAYLKKDYDSSFLSSGYIVLRLDGRVEWMKGEEFQKVLSQQQSPEEKSFTEQYP
jgi:hypothetical protein